MKALAVFILGAALVCAGCGDEASPTSASRFPEVTLSTELFSGVLPVNGTKFYSYTVSDPGTVTTMLASLTTATGATMTNRLELGIGVPAGTGCAVRQAGNVPPSLVPQLTQSSPAGTFCVSLTDVEGLPASMNFAIRIVHP